MTLQAGRGAARLQRVPFIPELLDSTLGSSTIEELHGLLAQLEAREAQLPGELDVAQRLAQDIPGAFWE